MPLYHTRRHVQRGLGFVFVLLSLSVVLSTYAQNPDEAITPAPSLTQEVLPLATEPLIPPVLIEATEEPTVEPTPVAPTESLMPSITPSLPPTLTAVVETTSVPLAAAPLTLVYQATFDGAYPSDLSPKTGWLQVVTPGALQSGTGALPITYTGAVFADVAVEARFLLNTGDAQVTYGRYRAVLSSGGSVALYSDQAVLGSATAALTPNAWALLRLERRGTQFQVSVNGILLISSTETAPISEAQVGFAASAGAVLRVDDFAVYSAAGSAPATPTTGPKEALVPTSTNTSVPAPLAPMPPTALSFDLEETGRPVFDWADVSGAAHYRLEVNEVCGDGTPVYQAGPIVGSAHTIPTTATRLYQGSYVLCVKAVDAQNAESAFASLPFQVIYNNSLEQNPGHSPFWMGVYNMPPEAGQTITYKIYIDNETTFTAPYIYESPIFTATNNVGGVYQYNNPFYPPNGRYVWRVVRYINGTPEPVFSLVYRDLFMGAKAKALTKTNPPDESTINAPTLLTWNPITTPTDFGPIDTYRLIVQQTSPVNATNIYMIPVGQPTEFNFVPVANSNRVRYSWRVEGLIDEFSATSYDISVFTVDNVVPIAPTISAPVNNASLHAKRPVFTWSQDEPDNKYVVTIRNAATQEIVLTASDVYPATFTPSTNLAVGSYTFSVQAKDALHTSPASTVSFSIVPQPTPPAVTGLQPIDGGSMNIHQSVTWTAAVTAGVNYTYDVQFGSDSAFASLVAQASALTTLTYKPGLPIGEYDWRVRVINEDGVAGPWTSAHITIVPPIVDLPPPVLKSALSTGTGHTQFEWVSSGSGMTYVLEVNNVCGDGTPFYTATSTSTTHLMPTTSQRLYQGLYLACSKVIDAAGHESPVASQSFKVIYSTSEMHNPLARPMHLSFFNLAGGAGETITYKIFIDTEPTFTAPYAFTSEIFSTTGAGSYSTSFPPGQGRYYWRVLRYINGVAEPVASLVSSDLFIGDYGSAPSINTIAPMNTPTTIVWNASVTPPTFGAVEYYRYKLEYGSTLIATGDVPANAPLQYLFTPPAGVNYRQYDFQVVGMVGETNATSYATTTFVVDMVPPDTPSFTAPTANSVLNQPRPAFTLSSVSGAQTYTFQLLDATTQAEIFNVTQASRFYTPTINLFNGSYIIRGQVKDMVNLSEWTSTTFSIQNVLPPPIDNLKPLNNTPIIVGQGLTWNAITNAEGAPFTYDVQIGTTSAFTTLRAQATGLTTTSYTPSALTEGTYWWRVRGVNQSGAAGNWVSQQMIIDLTPPAKPTLSTPSQIFTGRPLFSWGSVTGAASYQVEINNVCGDGSPIFSKTVTTNSYQMAATDAPLIQGPYVYCVKAIDAAQNISPYSTALSFTVLYNSSPSNNFSAASYAFSWGNVTGMPGETITYKLILDTESTFTPPLLYEIEPTSANSHNPYILPNLTYYWRVIRYVNGVADPINTSQSFTMTHSANDPRVPPVSPISGAVVTTPTVTLRWNQPTMPYMYSYNKFRVEVYEGPTKIITDTVNGSAAREYSFTAPANKNNVLYYWRVIGMLDAEPVTAFAAFSTFYVDNVPPAAPVITSPVTGYTSTQTNMSFAWNAVAGATSYKIAIQSSATQSDVVAEQTVTNTTFATTLPLGAYVFRVRAADANSIGDWSTSAFSIVNLVPGGSPALISPADGTAINAPVTLSWAKSITQPNTSTITHYQVHISSQPNFADTILKVDVSTDDPQQLTYTPAANTNNATYYWRVVGINGSEFLTTYDTRVLYVDNVVPVAPTIGTPAANEVVPSRRPLVQWIENETVNTYVVTLKDVTTQAELAAPQTVEYGLYQPPLDLKDGSYTLSIVAKDKINVSPAGTVTFSVFSTYPPSTTTMMYPPSNGTMDNVKGLWWEPVLTNGTPYTYDLQMSTTSNFSSFVVNVTGLTQNSYMPPASVANGLYYWRLRTVSAVFGSSSWGGTRVEINRTAPAVPVVSGPVNGALYPIPGPMPTLAWGAVPDAVRYDIQLSVTANFASPAGFSVETTSVTLDLPLSVGTYYWRVAAAAANNLVSSWSDVRSFVLLQALTPTPTATALSAPLLIEPRSSVYATQTTLVWSAVQNALTYRVELDDNEAFSSPTTVDVSTTSHPLTNLTSGLYYWRVAAVAGSSVSAWSEVLALHVDTAVTATPTPHQISAPVLVAPAQGSTITNQQPAFSWEAVPDATLYLFQISTSPVFGSSFVELDTTSYTPPTPLASGMYYWRVYADAPHTYSDWSAPRTVSIEVPPTATPTATLIPMPTLVSPAHQSLLTATTATMNVSFKWTSVGAGVGYTLVLDTDPSFSSVDRTCMTTALTCTINGLSAGTYYWQVHNNGATYGAYSSFTISPAAPRAVTLVSPANGRALQPNERPAVNLAWSWGTTAAPSGAPFTYDVEVSAETTFGVLLASGSDLAAPNFTTPALADGTYYWRARAVNAYDVPGAWSATFSFMVDSVAPLTAPSLTAPAANAVLSTARPTLAWGAVTGTVRYSLEIASACGDDEPFYTINTLTTTSHTLPATASALPQGTYQACVTAYDASGNGITSAPRAFTISLALTPTAGTFVTAGAKPTFTWAAAPGKAGETVRYHLHVFSVVADQMTAVYESPALTTTSHAIPTALTQGNYSWWVTRSVNGVQDTGLDRLLFAGPLPAGPAITAPAANQLTNTSIDLEWTSPTMPNGVDALDYQVQISTSATFSSLLIDQTVALDAPRVFEYMPLPTQNRVTLYSRVRGLWEGLPVTQWSTRSFVVDVVPPAAPVISAPAANALVNTVRPTFVWGAVPTATQYRVTLYNASTLQAIAAPQVVTTTSYTPTANLPQDTLVVGVEASDGLNWGSVSRQTFTVRLGTAPAQNATVTTNRPVFTWVAVPGATGYTLEVDNTTDFSSPHFSVSTTAPTYTPTDAQKLTNGVYVWRVKANNTDYPVLFGSRTFIYGVAPKPTGLFAASALTPTVADTTFNANEAANVVFTWAPLSVSPLYYQIDLSTAATFPGAGTLTRTSATTSLPLDSIDLGPDGVKYWRVRGIYSGDATGFGVWSDVKSFTVDRSAPPVPLLNANTPSVSANGRPTLSWFASAGATRYLLTVIDVATNQPTSQINQRVVTTTSYTLPTTLAPLPQNNQTGYLWFVQAEDAAGNRSASSLQRPLTVAAMLTPAQGAIVADTTPVFTWGAVAGTGAATWRLEISTSETMSPLVYSSPSPLAPAAASFTLPNASPLSANTLYYWRVYRTTENLTTIKGQPFIIVESLTSVTPQLSAPGSGQWINAANSTTPLTWSSPTQAGIIAILIGYQVEIAKTNTFAAASLVHTSQVTAASLTLPTLPDGIYYWRVRARFQPNGALGPVSAVRSFKLDTTAPGVPLLNTPVANALLTDSTPAFTWGAAAGTPAQYVLELSSTPGFDEIFRSVVISAPTLTYTLPAANALPNSTLYWRVRAKDAAGNLSAAGPGRRLVIAAP